MNPTKCPHCGAEENTDRREYGEGYVNFACGTITFTAVHHPYSETRGRLCYERQIAALQAELDKRQWQPIETAPRNKQAICFSPATHGPNSRAAWIRSQYPDDSPFRITTHWQPLPEPPKE